MTDKSYPTKHLVFFYCGQCGGYHWDLLPPDIDCRDDAHRFTLSELDARYGPVGWEPCGHDAQMETFAAKDEDDFE
jgi:hypothetical protein